MKKSQWKSQKILADELGLTTAAICNWVRRKDKRIKWKKDENTGMTLVRLVEQKK